VRRPKEETTQAVTRNVPLTRVATTSKDLNPKDGGQRRPHNQRNSQDNNLVNGQNNRANGWDHLDNGRGSQDNTQFLDKVPGSMVDKNITGRCKTLSNIRQCSRLCNMTKQVVSSSHTQVQVMYHGLYHSVQLIKEPVKGWKTPLSKFEGR